MRIRRRGFITIGFGTTTPIQVADIRNAYANGDIDKNEAAKLIEELQNEERDRLSQKNGGECQKVSQK